MNMHCQTKLVARKSAVQNIEIVISLYEPKPRYGDLDLEDSNSFFAHDTLAYTDVPSYWVWLQKVK